MDELRRLLRNFLIALAAPFVVILMIPLALLAGLAYYLTAVVHGFWLLVRALPGWIRIQKNKPALRQPHFLKAPAPGKPVE